MAKRRADTLDDLHGISARLRVTCRVCGRTGVYPIADVITYFRARGWSRLLAHATVRFPCEGAVGRDDGCGARDVELRADREQWTPPPPPKPAPLPHPDDRPRGSHRKGPA